MNITWRYLILMGILSTLTACGGGGGSDADGGYAGTGQLTLGITDAPVDGAKAVWITIDDILLKRSEGNGNEKRLTLDVPDTVPNVASDDWEITPEGHLRVNLLALSQGAILPLFDDETVTSGTYQWVRFSLVDGENTIIWEDDSEDPLELPANKNELKTSGSFTVGSNESVAYVIDWDLRKSIVEHNGDYRLKPVLHIKRDGEYAHITGSIADDPFNTCAVDDAPMVYVFSGFDATPDDLGSPSEPVISVPVSADPDQQFYVGPVDPGEYTFAFTCDGLLDDPENGDDTLTFPANGTVNVTLQSGMNTALLIP